MNEARFGPTHLCNEALKLLQEASATMGECRCIMDYVISHNADGVREFRRVSEAEPRLEAEVLIFWESENRFDFSCRLWSCWNDPKSLLSTRSNLCVDSNFVLTGCGTLEDWCTCGSFWNQKVVIEHPRCSFVTMGSRAGRVLGRVSEAKPGKRKSFSLKHWDDFEVLLKQFSLCSSFFWYSSLFFPSFVSMTHVINQWVSTIRIYLFGTSYVPSPEMMNTPRSTQMHGRRLPEDLQPGAAQVVDLSDEDCCVLDSQWHDFYLSSHHWEPPSCCEAHILHDSVLMELTAGDYGVHRKWVEVLMGVKCVEDSGHTTKRRCCPWSSSTRGRRGGQETTRAYKRYVGRDAEIFMGTLPEPQWFIGRKSSPQGLRLGEVTQGTLWPS